MDYVNSMFTEYETGEREVEELDEVEEEHNEDHYKDQEVSK